MTSRRARQVKRDHVGEAIAATDRMGVQMQQINVLIESTGRPFVLLAPKNLTDAELLEMVAWMTGGGLRSSLAGASPLIRAAALPVVKE